jgi:hypothetical protein
MPLNTVDRLVNVVLDLLQSHPPRTHGQCPVCHHFGDDCTASVALRAVSALVEVSPFAARAHHERHGDMDGDTCLLAHCAIHHYSKR